MNALFLDILHSLHRFFSFLLRSTKREKPKFIGFLRNIIKVSFPKNAESSKSVFRMRTLHSRNDDFCVFVAKSELSFSFFL